jgi:hypothetical protein
MAFPMPVAVEAAPSRRVGIKVASVARALALPCAFLSVTILVQVAVGAYATERSNYSDEAAHFMNGMLVRDYLTQGLGTNPLHFAEQYYLSYPKIAPGMWPPLFHGLLGIFMLPGWPPEAAALILLAMAEAWIAWRLYRVVATWGSQVVAVLVAGVFMCVPAVVDLTSAVMVDIVVAALALEATYWLAVFFSTEDWRHAAVFGFLAACCCLTKGNGLSLVLVPPLLILFTRRFSLLRRPGLYVAAAIVLVLAAPLLSITYRLDAAIGDFGPVTQAEMLDRLAFYGEFLRQQLGAVTLVVACIGIVEALRRQSMKRDDELSALAPAMTALVVAAFVFHILNPHRTAAGRYMALAIAPFLSLVPMGIARVGSLIPRARWWTVSHVVVLGAVAIGVLTAHPAMAMRRPLGYRDVIDLLQTRESLAGQTLLVVSDEIGEGAMVTELAVRRPLPWATVVRASKLLANQDWQGHNFQMLYSSSSALMHELEDLHVRYLVVDCSHEAAEMPYFRQINELIKTNGSRLEQIYEGGQRRPLTVYQLKYQSPGPAKKLHVDLTYSLGRSLER